MSRILIVDDEKLIVKGLKFSLEQDGLEVDCAYDGEEGLNKIREGSYDLILLDLMLPKMNGYEVCQEVRGFSNVPIIMLTAKSEDMDKILGLEYGADDYITKPFNVLEVKARVKAIMRRVEYKPAATAPAEALRPAQNDRLEYGDLKLDTSGRRAYVAGREVNLTAKEFELLELFVKHPNQVYTRDKLLELVWGADYPGDGRTVDVHIRRLREKIESNPGEPAYVRTKWGVGYYLA
ncbi:MAG: response regulator transcription factor [Lachnospiraceae bacterium]|nr:response regulator transcription factor [Lachnospiraceae bacterium]